MHEGEKGGMDFAVVMRVAIPSIFGDLARGISPKLRSNVGERVADGLESLLFSQKLRDPCCRGWFCNFARNGTDNFLRFC